MCEYLSKFFNLCNYKALRTVAGATSREFTPAWFSRRRYHCRGRFERADCDLAGVSLSRFMGYRLANCHRLRCGIVFYRSFPFGKSWRTSRTARHKPNVSVLLLFCGGVIFRAFFLW
jgi:hypothetical protein